MLHSVINEQMATRVPSAWRGTSGVKPAAQALLPHWIPGAGIGNNRRVAWSGRFVFNCSQWSSLGALAKMQVIAGLRRFVPQSVSDASVVQQLDLLCSRQLTGAAVVSIGPSGVSPAGCACSVASAPDDEFEDNFTGLESQKENQMPSFISRDGLRSAGAATQTAYKNGTASRGRPAGQVDYGYGTPGSIYGAGGNATNLTVTYDDSGNSVAPGTPGATTSTSSQIFGVVGQALGIAGTDIAAAINGGNAQEIARINAANASHIADIQQQMAAANTAAQQQNLAQQLAAARQLQAIMTQSTTSNMPYYVGLAAVGGLAIVAAAFFLSRGTRHNPVVGRRGRRHFVSAAKAKRMRRR